MKKRAGFTQEERYKLYLGQIERALRTKDFLPYFLMSRGPDLKICPIHGKNKGLVLRVDDPYWIDYPMRKHPDCKRRVRQLTKREYEKKKREGVLDPDAPPILDEHGRLTGNREKRYIPITANPIFPEG